MILTQSVIIYLMLVIARTISLLGILPQIILNYRSKSTKGLSNIFLAIYFIGYVANLFYVYGLSLPIVYKITAPLSFLFVSILVFQYFFYNKYKVTFRLILLFCVVFLLFFLLVILDIYFSTLIGNLFGWVSFIIWFVYLLPQMFRIFFKKSVEGFSLSFVVSGFIGNLLELIAVFVLRLPIQSVFITSRGLLFYSIFCLQFWMYRKKWCQDKKPRFVAV